MQNLLYSMIHKNENFSQISSFLKRVLFIDPDPPICHFLDILKYTNFGLIFCTFVDNDLFHELFETSIIGDFELLKPVLKARPPKCQSHDYNGMSS